MEPGAGPYLLQGEWEVRWGELHDAASFGESRGPWLSLPGSWSGTTASDGTPVDTIGANTLRARVRLPSRRDPREPWMIAVSTLNRPYVVEVRDLGGAPLIAPLRAGEVGLDAASTRHAHAGAEAVIRAGAGDEIEVVVQNSAFFGRAKPEKFRLTLGPVSNVAPWLAAEHQAALTLFGVTLVMGIYHLCLFALRRSERSPLFFGMFCLAIAVREFVKFDYLEARWPLVDLWSAHNRLEYLGFFVAVPCFLAFLDAVFPEHFWRAGHRIFAVIALAASVMVILVPMSQILHVLQAYEVLTLLVVLYLTVALGRLMVRGDDRVLVWLIGGGTFVLIATVVNDILSNRGLFSSVTLSHYGVFAFIFVQSMVLAIRNMRARGRSEVLAVELDRKNAALVRFVPRELLSLLGRADVIDVELGDQSRREMTVLFCDIRGFTSISERLGPAETFALLNGCLGKIAPIIRERGGFVDKYIGDALMALFPNRPADAVAAAVAIVAAVRDQARHAPDAPAVSVGIGVHTGTVMVGTIGEPLRMEGTVISDVVNFASRLEGLTRRFDVSILLSGATLAPLSAEEVARTRPLGLVKVKGRNEPMEIFELYGEEGAEVLEAKARSRGAFAEALTCLGAGRPAEAERCFREVSDANPQDGPARFFAERSAELARGERVWRGAWEFGEK